MRENDGRKLDHKVLEALRMRAVDQVNSGARAEDVAAALGFHRTTVYGWLAKYRKGGRGALLARPVPGRPPRLSPLQMRRLREMITGSDPRQYQFELALWTRSLVRELIQREFAVCLSDVSVGRLLAKMGLPLQRPIHRAQLHAPQAVDLWKRESYPAIAALAAADRAVVYFADQVSAWFGCPVGSRGEAGRSRGVMVAEAPVPVNLVSAVPPKGALRFAVFEGTASADSFIAFCNRLRHDAHGRVYLIVDSNPCHRAKVVQTYVASTSGQLRLFHLPGYVS